MHDAVLPGLELLPGTHQGGAPLARRLHRGYLRLSKNFQMLARAVENNRIEERFIVL